MKKENEEKKDKKVRKKKKGALGTLHLIQHICFAGAACLATVVLLSSFVTVEGRKDTETFFFDMGDTNTEFEDSMVFNKLLGRDISDIICYGAIRSQMETDGKFDPKKVIDVTAFDNRYSGIAGEYITARYYLEDLLKWAQYGFETEETYMTGEEADQFLSRTREVTYVEGNVDGGSYLNTDLEQKVRVVDVSGNVLSDPENPIRDNVTVNILKNRYHTVDGKNIEDYVSSWEEYTALRDHVQSAAEDLLINYNEYLTYQDYYDNGNSNFVYFVRRTTGDQIVVYSNENIKNKSMDTLTAQLQEECSRYLIYDPQNMSFITNTKVQEKTPRYVLNGYSYAYPDDTQILVGVKTGYKEADAFQTAKNAYSQYSPYLWQNLIWIVLLGGLYLLLMVVLTAAEGKAVMLENGEKKVLLKWEDKIPIEIMLVLAIVTGELLVILGYQGTRFLKTVTDEFTEGRPLTCGLALLYALLVSGGFSFFYFSLIRRIKAGTLWKDSLLAELVRISRRAGSYLYGHANTTLRVLIPSGVLLMAVLISILIAYRATAGTTVVLILMLILIGILVIISLLRAAVGRDRILTGIKKMNAGDMNYQIPEEGLTGDNLVLAREVNHIGDGIREAVAISMKDERLKADLITNVSHDIKTPLTSIINYVDLLKRENIEDEKVKEYIAVLDAKSQRLKQLTDDLVEASKISSGNIILHFERIDLIELLHQSIGEFSEKFEGRGLIPVLRTENGSACIEADSRRIFRVIENLFSNVIKYALPGTRVYIDVEDKNSESGTLVQVAVKNISENPVSVSGDELTERFIRGDESRTTEGSGLGLSIAKNLTVAMNGQLNVKVDGDLFKVILQFPKLEEQKETEQ